MQRYQNYVLGQWVDGQGADTNLYNAINGNQIGTVSSAGIDFSEVLDYGRKHGRALRKMTFQERGRMLKALALFLMGRKAKYYEVSAWTGATKVDSWIDIEGGIGNLFANASLRRQFPDLPYYVDGVAAPLSKNGTFIGHHIMVPKEGVAVHINAFNFPIWGMLEKIAVNLMAGVPAVVKPSEFTSFLTEVMVRDIIDSKILPEGSLQLVCGLGRGLIDSVDSRDVVTFTGSAATGKMLKALPQIAAESVPFNLEADSLNATILGQHATPGTEEFDLFIKETVKEITIKAGQKCTAVRRIIEGKSGDFENEIRSLDKIAKILRKNRLKKGALNIESEETRFKLNEKGMPNEVVIKTSKDAHKLIEEFMLLANRYVATFLSKTEKGKDPFPMIYRVHDAPDPAKMEVFAVFIEKFGHKIDLHDPSKIAEKLNTLFEELKEENEFSLIQSMAIRSMAKASYETENIGHYGLAFHHYSHFTSPIRRYADLVVHRILQEELTAKKHRYGNELNDVCKRISRNERKAAEAERESTKYFMTLFVSEHIGEVFNGTISGIADHGMFVRMDENHCEGMVPMNEIPGDRFYFDQEKFRIIGSKTKREFNFGDRVQVRVSEVSLRKRQIDLELVV